ncbi:cyclic lactone autoinducer peptide [Moorella sp. ACPs]
MKRLAMVFLAAVAFMATFLAYINAASACYYGFYEPEVPPSLRK